MQLMSLSYCVDTKSRWHMQEQLPFKSKGSCVMPTYPWDEFGSFELKVFTFKATMITEEEPLEAGKHTRLISPNGMNIMS